VVIKEELEEIFKEKVVEMASSLLFEAGFGGLKKGELYNVLIEHIKEKIFNNKKLGDVKKEDLEIALDNLEEVKRNFTPEIVSGILGGKNA